MIGLIYLLQRVASSEKEASYAILVYIDSPDPGFEISPKDKKWLLIGRKLLSK
jgi:hypothetical protein